MIETAQKAAKKHPSLYLAVLEYLESRGKRERQLRVGEEALEAMDKSCRLRSRENIKRQSVCCMIKSEIIKTRCKKRRILK